MVLLFFPYTGHIETAHNVIGILGIVISSVLFLLPARTFYSILRNNRVERLEPYPFVATSWGRPVNFPEPVPLQLDLSLPITQYVCMLWILYGVPCVRPDTIHISIMNGVGLVIDLIYLVIYFIRFPVESRKSEWLDFRRDVAKVLLMGVLSMTLITLFTIFYIRTPAVRSNFIGFCSTFLHIVMFSTPLMIMGRVTKTDNLAYMPFHHSLANFLNCCIWISYAVLKLDIAILTSYGLGALVAAAQLILHGKYYYRRTPEGDGAHISPPEIIFRRRSEPELKIFN